MLGKIKGTMAVGCGLPPVPARAIGQVCIGKHSDLGIMCVA